MSAWHRDRRHRYDQIAAVLTAHFVAWRFDNGYWECQCGDTFDHARDGINHVANQLVDA